MSENVNKLLATLAIAHRIANENAMCNVGLHSGQAQILSSLWENDGQSQAELVRNLCVSPPTVNKMISRLTENRFIIKKKCSKDRRLMRVYLTKKGLDVKTTVEEEWSQLESEILKDLTETEKILLPILLEKLNKNLSDMRE